MGAAGIKRRKKIRRRNAEPELRMSEGDVQRLFGRFSWNAYSPAGGLEREGFFLRQLNRYEGRRWRAAVVGTRFVVYLVLIVLAVGIGAMIGKVLFR